MSAPSIPPVSPDGRDDGLIPLSEPLRTTTSRKDDHLRLAAKPAALHARSSGLERFRLVHRALPERGLRSVDLTTTLFGRTLQAPILVSAMTGGTERAGIVNGRLAEAAARQGCGMVLGSGRALLRSPELLPTYVGVHRPPLLLANLGAAQLLEPQGLDDAERLVELLGADGLTIHCNALQEAVQPEGQTEFSGLFSRVAELCTRLAPMPVIVKEVGFGISGADALALTRAGVAGVDVAGSGGTNWALIEGARDQQAGELASAFADWGIPTADALQDVVAQAGAHTTVIASGGLNDGVEAATCLALGADAAGFARQLLLAAEADRVDNALVTLIEQLRIATWLTGAGCSADLGRQHLQGAGA